ncbi:MAG: cytidine deaminase [Bacillota bacterium]
MEKKTKNKMLKMAKEVKKNAYVPYSNFPLAAVLLTKEGEFFTGVNIENASFGLTNCAERTAIFKAVSEGYKNFEALLLYGGKNKTITPCGACRQVINEYGDDIEVIMVNENGDEVSMLSSELLPGAFQKGDMEDDI